ncbi:hypothetical protein HK103_005695 [Boothiomyces macroporosus]|uniref:Mid2 domain-containing protein n=1 Tax=Boothiomyces macroporosus TaxID=261099 RepID=A0AAD5UEU7_9FUNG|nr:hypothetical protein HK103_005695 [Boothiomyces macroporosus]
MNIILLLIGSVFSAGNNPTQAAPITAAPPVTNPPSNPTTVPVNPTNPPSNPTTNNNNNPVTTLAPIVVTSMAIVPTIIDGKTTYVDITYSYTIIPTATGNATASDNSSAGGISERTKVLLIVFGVVFVILVIGIFLFRTYGVRSSDAFKNRLKGDYDDHSSRSAENVTGGPARPIYNSSNNSGNRQYITESVTGPARPRGSPYQDSGVNVYRLNNQTEPTLPDINNMPYYSPQHSPNRQYHVINF